jgi:hypothetical protein
MKFLLDTCVISEPKQKQPNKKVLEWIDAQDEPKLYLSVLTIGEIRKGIARLDSGKKKVTLEKWQAITSLPTEEQKELRDWLNKKEKRDKDAKLQERLERYRKAKEWLAANSEQYMNKWVCLYGDKLITVDDLTNKNMMTKRGECYAINRKRSYRNN